MSHDKKKYSVLELSKVAVFHSVCLFIFYVLGIVQDRGGDGVRRESLL